MRTGTSARIRLSAARSLFPLFVLCLALCLAACTKKEEGLPLSIAYPAAGAIINTQVGLVLERKDFLKQHGFSGSVAAMGTGKELKVALVSGKADVILTSETNFPVLLGEGFDALAINSLGSAGRIGLLVKNEKYKNLSDLKGKSIAAIFGTSTHQPAVEWAREAGGAETVNMASIAAMQAALESGNIDAIVSWDPYLTSSLKQKSARVLKESTFELISVASGKYAKENPGAIERVNSMLKDALLFVATHREEVNAQFSAISQLEVPVIHEASMKNSNYANATAPDISISPGFVRKLTEMGTFLFDAKIVRQKPEVESRIWKP